MANSLFSTEIHLKRAAGEGFWDPDTMEYLEANASDIYTMGSIQPYKEGSTSKRESAGFSDKGIITVFSEGVLIAHDQTKKTVGDELYWKGSTYICKAVEDWTDAGFLPHYQGLFYIKDNV